MPLVSHIDLPTFARLAEEGQTVLSPERAQHQDIREQHIGLLNMMPDAALAATERQFFRLVGASNPIAQFYMHPFTLPELQRSEKGRAYTEQYYETFEDIKARGLDALIITGANVTHTNLEDEAFWTPLTEVFAWAQENVTSILCSCLATHAMMQHEFGIRRRHMKHKRWGVYSHQVVDRTHPLVSAVNTRFDVPHSRFNDISREDFESAGLKVLAESVAGGVHLAVSEDLFRVVYFQGHPEYDLISLLKEYKREIAVYFTASGKPYPLFPVSYFDKVVAAIFNEYAERVREAKVSGEALPEFPEALVEPHLNNTWHDTGAAVVGNWIGLVYQLTHKQRKLPFMDGVDKNDPLGIKSL